MEPRYIHSISIQSPLPQQEYYSKLPAVKCLQNTPLTFSQPVTFLVGENGTGKSTLIEAIAVAFGLNPEGGSRNFNFSTASSHSDLHKYLLLRKDIFPKDSYFLRAESVYNVASYINELDRQPAASPPIIQGYGGVSLHHQSHGESFLALVQNRMRSDGLYIWDEPEAALSPLRLLTLLCEIHRLVQNRSQLIIATHSPILMAYPQAQILELSANGIRQVQYDETEHVTVTRQFLNQPKQMLRHLLQNK